MKLQSKIYASALLDCYEKNQAVETVINFLKIVRRNGDFSKLPAILRDFKKIYNRKNVIREVNVKLARENRNLAAEVKNLLKLKEEPLAEIDDKILGGAVIIIDDEIIVDGSARSRIESLFEK